MRNMISVLLLLLASSCTKQVLNEPPLGYSFMPSYLNIDSIQPIVIQDTNRVVDSTMKDFVSVPIDSGLLITRSGKQTLQPGVLISDRKAALYVFYRSSWQELQKELYYTKYLMHEYYDKSKAAEVLYQGEIQRWKKASERSWLEKNIGYVGFVSGLLTVLGVDFALLYGVK